MTKDPLALSFFLLTVSVAPLGAMEVQHAKVFEVTGRVECASAQRIYWKPLLKNSVLEPGARIRTDGQGSAQIKLGRDFASVLKLGSDAYVKFKDTPSDKIYLEQGELYVIRESDSESAPTAGQRALEIRTKDLRVGIKRGGCVITASRRGTAVKVFQERVQVTRFTAGRARSPICIVREGHQFFSEGPRTGRLQYKDYEPWQDWIRAWYERKDFLAAEKLHKELYAR